jgi:alginate O-acetyltransferase complex protein AlgI
MFYFWGEVDYAWVFLLSVVFNYLMGRIIGLSASSKKSLFLVIACIVNLVLLGYFKYANFIADNINQLLSLFHFAPIRLDPVHLPIGISFVTFHALSYLIDIKRGTSTEQKDPMDVLLYLALFPQLIAGPIIRYNQIAEQIKNRFFSIDDVYAGIRRFIFGLSKKVLIANQLGLIADSIFSIHGTDITTPLAWLGVTAYTLQLYFDFSGYSCMAIGLAMIFGFRFPENFNYPYISKSIQEFWRRWHISLSSWFRDYLYIPLGGNRHGTARTYFNLVLVFFLCGLWHGSSWNFVIWGLFHGSFLVIERIKLGIWLEKLWTPFAHTYTILVFMSGWVFFRAENPSTAISFLKAMAGFGNTHFTGDNANFYLTSETIVTLLIAIALSTPVWRGIDRLLQLRLLRQNSYAGILQLIDGIWLLILFVLCAVYINEGSYNPFIYFRF